MIPKLKKPFLFTLALLPIALVSGVFVGIYQMETISQEMLDEILAEIGSKELLLVITALQSVLYTAFCGFFGYILAEKIGLMKSLAIQKKPLLSGVALGGIVGLILALDYWTFGNVIKEIQTVDAAGLSVSSWIASVLYGGVVEEVMLRLFFMSLIAFVVWKLFYKKYDKENIPTSVFVIANVIAALAFAAGHLPATVMMFEKLTALIIFRCFLLNGGFALVFGWVYRKYGIAYAAVAHAMAHIVSKLIWMIFI